MWQILKTLVVQGILAKTVLRSFGWLAWLLPVGFLLKFVGLPLLAVLGLLALPVLALLLVIGLPIFVVLLLRQVDRDEVVASLAGVHAGWLVLAVGVEFVALWVRALRWRVVLDSAVRISTGEAWSVLMIGYAANNLLPLRAGELVRRPEDVDLKDRLTVQLSDDAAKAREDLLKDKKPKKKAGEA